jgi:RNA polymerase sigma-70 factor, ECF subfamily
MNASATARFPRLSVTAAEGTRDAGSRADLQKELSDEVLLKQIEEGSREATSSLFTRYARMVRGVAYRVLRDPCEADDLLQDIFVLVHRLCGTFDPSRGSARTWILQMTYRRAISRRRYLTSRHFYSHQELDEFAAKSAVTGTARLVENTLEGTLGNKDLQDLFQKLSEDQRQALLLRFVEGYTLPEIAEKMGQSRANIKNHYFRGLEKLRKHLFSGKLAAKRAL